MGQRIRKVKATEGLIYFAFGVQEIIIQDFLKANKIERVADSPESVTSESFVVITVPPADEYICPDHVYPWVQGAY